MIQIKTEKENDKFKRVIMSGHAGYAEHGQDIVCAGVSASLHTIVNCLSYASNVVIDEEPNETTLKLSTPTHVTDIIVEGFLETMAQIASTYPGTVKLEEEE